MASGQAGRLLLEYVGDFQIAPPLLGHIEGQRNLRIAVRRNGRQFQRSLRNQRPIQCQGPGGADQGHGIHEIQVIFQCQNLTLQVIGRPERSVDILIFKESCVRPAVRIDQTIQTEIRVMLQLAVVAAVPVHVFAGRSPPLVDGVVTPLPDESAAECGILFRQIQIFLKITGAVAHGVAIFHQEKRLVGSIVQIVCHLGKGGIHAPEQVDVGDVKLPIPAQIEGALIVRQPRGVRLLGPPQGFLKGDAIAALVAHGPDQNAGAVPVPQDHGAHPVERGLHKVRIVCNSYVCQPHPLRIVIFAKIQRRRPMALIVRLIDHIESHAVAELIEPRNIGIVAGSNRVEVVGLDHAKVQQGLVHRTDRSGDRI